MPEQPTRSKKRNPWTFRRQLWIASLIFLACLLIWSYFYRGVDLEALHAEAQEIDGWLVALLMAVLPVLGAPVSPLYLLAGARFGSSGGLLVAAATIACNLLATYAVANGILRNPVRRLFERFGHELPQVPPTEQAPFTLLAAIVPSAPYALKNYALALSGLNLRIYVGVCLPAHLFTASVAIFIGDLTASLSPGRIIFLLGYAVTIGTASRWLYKRVHEKRAAEADSMEAAAVEGSGPKAR